MLWLTKSLAIKGIKLICFIGCFFHVYLITDQFLQFKVETSVKFIYPEVTIVPDLDLKLQLPFAIDMKKLCNNRNHLLAIDSFLSQQIGSEKVASMNVTEKCSTLFHYPNCFTHSLTPLLTLGDFEHLLISPETWIDNITLQGFPGNLLANGICKARNFLTSNGVHIRISCKNGKGEPISLLTRGMLINHEGYMIVKLNFNSQIILRLIAPGTPLLSTGSSAKVIYGRRGKVGKYFISNHRTVIKYLEEPYETKCSNYFRKKVLVECINSYLTNQPNPGLFHKSVVKIESSSLAKSYNANLSFIPSNDERIVNLNHHGNRYISKCLNSVKQLECYKILYDTDSESIFDPTPVNSTDQMIIILAPSIEPDIHYSSYPFISISSYIIYIGSILSTWFGISILDRLQLALNLTQQLDSIVNSVKSKLVTLQENGSIKIISLIENSNNSQSIKLPLFRLSKRGQQQLESNSS